MKIALDWIADYLSPTPAAAIAADALMNAGLPVESIVDTAGAKGPTQVLDVEVTSNRTDCFCHVGIARELSAIVGGRFTKPPVTSVAPLPATPNAPAAASLAALTVEDAIACPYYSARILRNVKIAPSPDWLRKRLESVGIRPVNNVVDITNYVLMELGQPLHAFDYDKIAGRQIIVRRAGPCEKIVAIDGREYTLTPTVLVIADAHDPIAIAGIMGGKATEVSNATTTILLESARFDPLIIRNTARTLGGGGLKSESSFRFERGIDMTLAEAASKRAAQLILQLAGDPGGPPPELTQGMLVAGSVAHKSTQVSMRFKRYHRVIGIPISPDRALGILNALGFSPWIDENTARDDDDILRTWIPSHRLDVEREVDLIEEIARVEGYQHIPMLDRVCHRIAAESAREKAGRAILSLMAEAGFSEAITVTLVPEAEGRPFIPRASSGTESAPRALIHPLHDGWKADVLRPSLLPSLLAVRRTNQNVGIPDAHVFETGVTCHQSGDPALTPPAQRRTLAAVAGELSPLAALLGLLADRLNPAARIWIEPHAEQSPAGSLIPAFAPEAVGDVLLRLAGDPPATIGIIGFFTPDILRHYDLRHPAAGIELDWEALLAIYQPLRVAAPVPRFPAVSRDLSIVVEECVRWADINATLTAAGLAHLERIAFVATFRGKQVGEGRKSLTLTLDFRDPVRTLTNEEVDAQVTRAVETLSHHFRAALRA